MKRLLLTISTLYLLSAWITWIGSAFFDVQSILLLVLLWWVITTIVTSTILMTIQCYAWMSKGGRSPSINVTA